MEKVEAIGHEIEALSEEELEEFRRWFAAFDADAWDRQMEADARAGRLDFLAEEALEDVRTGKVTEL